MIIFKNDVEASEIGIKARFEIVESLVEVFGGGGNGEAYFPVA